MVQFDHMRNPFEMYTTPRKTLLGLKRQISHFYNLAGNDPRKVTRISYGEPFILLENGNDNDTVYHEFKLLRNDVDVQDMFLNE